MYKNAIVSVPVLDFRYLSSGGVVSDGKLIFFSDTKE